MVDHPADNPLHERVDKFLNELASFHDLPGYCIREIGKRGVSFDHGQILWENKESCDIFMEAVHGETEKKTNVILDIFRSYLKEGKNLREESFWEGYVNACLKLGRGDVIASHPVLEAAAARFQAQVFLLKDKPPE